MPKPQTPSGKRRSEKERAWQRARQPHQKAERREAILAAATELLDEAGIDGATLSAITRRAGLSKGNLYRYFESREAVLMALTLGEVERWSRALVERLEPIADPGDVEAVADVFSRTTAANPRLCVLFSALTSVLERNVSAEAVIAFKRTIPRLLLAPSTAVRDALPGLSASQARSFVLYFALFVAGTWPAANPEPAVAKLLSRKGFESLRVDFERTNYEHARALLDGLLARRR
ncbi:MAG: TetR/AcrR family transcriptional regulator [Myxococcota bacterium]